jgi:hypothetical protein
MVDLWRLERGLGSLPTRLFQDCIATLDRINAGHIGASSERGVARLWNPNWRTWRNYRAAPP